MEIIETHIKDLLIIKPKVFADARGYFFESYNEGVFKQNGITPHFVQDNQSLSNAGVLRGLHFQAPPHAQGKLVRVITGAVLDIAVDIRKNSPTYGQHVAIELTEENKTMFYIPTGFAHGFLTLKDNTIFSYKCTDLYHKASEGTVLWNDADLNINWNVAEPVLSEKDLTGTKFKEFNSPF
ncbi:MAG: dTDP-4-dehydrorhamnose 3,5-epimerase [Bacteroidetes bacterium]|jgi:dTDP-4-dehydrorhamnose 3,5-epimerase|nr:dTDP-4-dehydrorhamnose 3,5-epimerase [Bacteroidota bacterium]MDF2451158.1 dTDP-4-dehydrorhamnose 3,5-epimerase [Bacteroidota bacterium]